MSFPAATRCRATGPSDCGTAERRGQAHAGRGWPPQVRVIRTRAVLMQALRNALRNVGIRLSKRGFNSTGLYVCSKGTPSALPPSLRSVALSSSSTHPLGVSERLGANERTTSGTGSTPPACSRRLCKAGSRLGQRPGRAAHGRPGCRLGAKARPRVESSADQGERGVRRSLGKFGSTIVLTYIQPP